MAGLLEMREKLKLLYSRNEVFIIPVLKFLLAFVTLTVVNGKLGYMSRVDNLAVVLIVSLSTLRMIPPCSPIVDSTADVSVVFM